ncbi:hypothetical protein BH23GEM4_BH23GEM4_01430 [soil metagenome]
MLIAKGQLGEPPFYFNLLLGSRYSVPATARHLSNLLEDLPSPALWASAGVGLFQLPMHALGIVMGGHCRVGIEDNIFHGFDRTELATNAGLIERLVHLSESFGRPITSHLEARDMLGMGAPAVGRPGTRTARFRNGATMAPATFGD